MEAECSVLGGMFIDQNAIPKAVEILDEGMFYREGHRKLYRAMLKLWEKGEVIDAVTLSTHLKNLGEYDSVGGAVYLAQLMDMVPTAANIEYHARIVREKAVLRRLIDAGTEIVRSAFEKQGEVEQILDEAEQKIFQVAQAQERRGFIWVKDLLWPAMEQIELLSRNHSAVTGVASGFTDLDLMTAGFQKGDLVIVAARPSMGKCLAFDSEIVLRDGSVVTIEELYRRRAAHLLTLGDDLKLGWTEPSAFVDDGEKPVFRVRTRLGRQVEATAPHPFLTVNGWKRLEELQVGQHIAVPRSLGVFGTEPMRECEVKLLAYLIGDGGLTQSNARLTNGNARIRQDFEGAVGAFGGLRVSEDFRPERTEQLRVARHREERQEARRAVRERLVAALDADPRADREVARQAGLSPATLSIWRGEGLPSRNSLEAVCGVLEIPVLEIAPEGMALAGSQTPNPLVEWLNSQGIWGKGAAEKFVPEAVFRLPRPQLALFLNRLLATDGWATVLKSGQPQVGYASASERLARQVQHLLLRFGILSALRKRAVRYRGERRTCWQLDITDAASLDTLVREIGIYGKEAAVARLAKSLASRRWKTNRDLIPVEVWEQVRQAKGEESWASLARRAGLKGESNIHAGSRALSRKRLAKLAEALAAEDLRHLAESDVYWDEIVAIEPLGYKQVYDLTIPETHNFVANDICVHNTAFTLNIAQHAAISARRPVAFFSLEMSKEALVQRMLTSEARVDASRVRTGRLKDEDYPRLAQAAGLLNTAPIYVDDTPAISVLECRAKARRLKSEHPELSLVIVDYLQLMQSGSKSENRQQEVSEISRGLKALAKELDLPVVALSQLSRAVESRPDKRPMMSDLRESGAIEQDADLIMFLYRPEYYHGPVDKDGNSIEGRAEVIIGKQRNGATGTVPLMFHKELTRFDNLSSRPTPAP